MYVHKYLDTCVKVDTNRTYIGTYIDINDGYIYSIYVCSMQQKFKDTFLCNLHIPYLFLLNNSQQRSMLQ